MIDSNALTEGPRLSSVDESLNIQNNASAVGHIGPPIATKPSPLMKLPTELRLRIFRYIFKGTKILVTDWEYGLQPRRQRVPGILGVSREIQNEAMDVEFNCSTIEVTVADESFRIWNRHIEVFDTAHFTTRVFTLQPIRNTKACCTLLDDVAFVFRKFKNFEFVFASHYDDGFLPLDWIDLVDTIYGYERNSAYAYVNGSRPYNMRQVAQTLATCLRLLGKVRDITIKVESNLSYPHAEMWILPAFSALRNVRNVQINDGKDFSISLEAEDAVGEERTIAEVVALMKGNSDVTINTEAEAMEDDWVALAKFIRAIDLNWPNETWEYLFKARVACFNVDKVGFENYRRDIIELWKAHLTSLGHKVSRVTEEFAALEAMASGQPK